MLALCLVPCLVCVCLVVAGPAPPPMASPPFAPHYHATHLGHAYPAAQSSVGLLSAGLAVSSQSMSGPPLAPLPASAPPLAPAPPPSYHPLPPQPGMPPQQQGLGYLSLPGHVGGAGGYGGGYGGPGYGYLGGPVLAPRTALSCTNCRKSKARNITLKHSQHAYTLVAGPADF
jgi:hypothetical protein